MSIEKPSKCPAALTAKLQQLDGFARDPIQPKYQYYL